MAVLPGPGRFLVGRGDLRNVKQPEPIRIVRRASAGMRPAKQSHQDGYCIQRPMADARRGPLPARRVHRQSRARVEAAPDQPQDHQQQYEIADIGMDRAIEKTIRACRDVVHPPAEDDHTDDRGAEDPVQGARQATPCGRSISYHNRCRPFAVRIRRADTDLRAGFGPEVVAFRSCQVDLNRSKLPKPPPTTSVTPPATIKAT